MGNAERMGKRKEENRPSTGENEVENVEAGLPRCRRLKRKCAEEANELIRAVIGSEMLNISPEDSFESSGEENNIFTSIFPREEDSGSSTENTSVADALPEGCDRVRGLPGTRRGDKNSCVPHRIELSILKKENRSCGMGSFFRKEEIAAKKDELRKTGLSQSSGSIPGGVGMQKRLKIMQNAQAEHTPRQEPGTKQNGVNHLASQHFAVAKKMDTSNQLKVWEDIGKVLKFNANKNHISNYNGSDLQEQHDVSDKGKRCPSNSVEGEQKGKLGCEVQTQDSCHEDTIGSKISSPQAKNTEQTMIYPIVESSEGDVLLRSLVSSYHQELNVCDTLKAEWVGKNSGDKNSSNATSCETRAVSGQNGLEILEHKDNAMELGLTLNINDGTLVKNRDLDNKDTLKEIPANYRTLSLPTLSEEHLSAKNLPMPELRKTLREQAKARLLAAGWKIELKPRAGKQYLDSVYVSPWGSAFWSLPRAWNALRKSLGTNASKNGKFSSTNQLRERKRPRECGGDFCSELNNTLVQLDNGEHRCIVSTTNPQRDIDPLMSMIFTEDLSLLRKRKKDRCKEGQWKQNIYEKYEHSMKGYEENGHSSKVLGPLQPVPAEKTGVNPCGLYGLDSERVVCRERGIPGMVSFSGNQMSMKGELSHGDSSTSRKLSHSVEVRSMHGKLVDAGDERNIHSKVLHAVDLRNIDGSVSDAHKQQTTCGNLEIYDQCDDCEKLFYAADSNMHHHISNMEGEKGYFAPGISHGKHLSAEETRVDHGGLSQPKNSWTLGRNISSGGDQMDVCEVLRKLGTHEEISNASEQRSILEIFNRINRSGKLFLGREQRNTNGTSNFYCPHGKHSDGKEQRTMCGSSKKNGIYGAFSNNREQSSLCGKACHMGGQRCRHKVLLSASEKGKIFKRTGNDSLYLVNKKCIEEKRSSALELPGTHEMVHAVKTKSISKKLSNSGEHKCKHANRMFCAVELKEEFFPYCKIGEKMLRKPISAESRNYELCNKSILKGLHLIQKEISQHADVLLASTKIKNGEAEKQPSVNYIADLEMSHVVPVFQRTEGMNHCMPMRDLQSKNEQVCKTIVKSNGKVEKVGMTMNNRERERNSNNSKAGQKSDKGQLFMAESNFNEFEASRVLEYEFNKIASKSPVDKAERILNQRHRSKINMNIIERDLSRQLSKLELDEHPSKREDGGRKSFEPPFGLQVGEFEKVRQFDEHRAARFGRGSSALHVGMKTKDYNNSLAVKQSHRERRGKICKPLVVSQAGRESYSQANKTRRKPKELEAGRLLNNPWWEKCPKTCTKGSDGKIENDIIIDDDNITLASILKNRKRLSRVTKVSGVLSVKNKPVTGRTIYSSGEKNKYHKGGCVLSVRSSSKKDSHCKGNKGDSSTSKRTALSWLIDNGIVSKGEPVEYLNAKTNRIMKQGWITRDGIYCCCCNRVLTISRFSTHAGSKVKWPFLNIFVQSGKSLTICQIEAWSAEFKFRKGGMRFIEVSDSDLNDDACGCCGDGGDLICCDKCPSTFHQDCLTLEDVPEGNWYCPNCTCAICGTVGHDEEDIASNFLICDQCELKYHKKCLHERAVHAAELKTVDTRICGEDCRKVSIGLYELLGNSNTIGEGLTWTLLRSINEDWKLCSPQRLAAMADCNTKLALSLSVMEECFERMVDPRTGIDMIPHLVYSWGSNFSRLNYQGFYTVVLEREDELISVASIRIHGRHFAEMPLIATCLPYRRQGMCRRLVNTIEKMLMSLNVEKLILSAVSDLMEYWTTVFGFKPLKDSDKQELKNMNIMTFPGTSLLQKSICRPESKKCFETDKEVEQATCIEGNGLLPQTQGDNPPCPQLEKTDTEASMPIVGEITDVNSLMQILPSRMIAKVEERRCEETLDYTSTPRKERTRECPEVDILDAEAQVDNVLGAQLEVDTEQVVVFENKRTGDGEHVFDDIADIGTGMKTRILQEEAESAKRGKSTERTFEVEEKSMLSCLEAEKLAPAHGDGEGQQYMIYPCSSGPCPQMQKDIEVSMLDKRYAVSAELVLDNTAYCWKREYMKRLPEEDEICMESVQKTSETGKRTSSCIKHEQFGAQAFDPKVDVHQKAQTESVACGHGDMTEVRMLKMMKNSGRSPEAKERWEHDKDSESGITIDKKNNFLGAKTEMQDLIYIDMEGRVLSEEESVNIFVNELSVSSPDKIHSDNCTKNIATVRDSFSDLASTNLYTTGSSGEGNNICDEQRNVDS